MRRGKCRFLILGSVIALCFPGQEIKVSLEEGIPVVYNLRQPLASVGVPHKFILVPDLIIASKGKGKKGAFDSVSDIRSDKSVNIYLFEAESKRIQIFSGTGIHINSIFLADEDVQENEISKEFYLVGGRIIIVGRKSIICYSPEGELVERIESYHGRRASLNHVNPHKMEENHLGKLPC